MTLDEVRTALLRLPDVCEGIGYCTPIFRVGRKMLVRFRPASTTTE